MPTAAFADVGAGQARRCSLRPLSSGGAEPAEANAAGCCATEVGKLRKRVALELVVDLERIYQRKKQATKNSSRS